MAHGSGDFGSIASAYAAGRRPFPNQVFAYLKRRLPTDRLQILDVGCGSGIATRQLADNFPKAEIIGVDVAEEMLAEARKEPSSGILYLRRDVTKDEMPCALGSLAALTAFSAYHWFCDDAEAVERLVSLLRPGGCFFVVNKNTVEEVIDGWPDLLELWTNGPIRRGKSPDYNEHFIRRNLQGHGLRVSSQSWDRAETYTLDQAVNLLKSSGLTRQVPEAHRESMENLFRRAAGDRLRKAGKIERRERVIAVLGVR